MDNVINIPVILKAYYSDYDAIDRHNKQRLDDIEIERNLRTKDWWKRVNTSIFGVILVVEIKLHQAYAGSE